MAKVEHEIAGAGLLVHKRVTLTLVAALARDDSLFDVSG